MYIQRLGCVVLLFASAITLHGQQPADDQQKQKSERRAKLIERIRADVEGLKLPENRALINAKLGAAIWGIDKDAAMVLFRSAGAELIAAQQFAEANKKSSSPFHDLIQGQSLRPQIINAVASRDAELALEQFYRSRPAAIERAMAGDRQNAKLSSTSAGSIQLAQSEINLEQRLIKMVADQKPERAAAILKDGIRRKLSGETLGMLQKLHEKEPTAADELAGDVLGRLNREKFLTEVQPNYDLINLSNSILGEFLRKRDADEKFLKFDESQIRSLALKVLDVYMNGSQRIGYVPMQQLEPIAKRFAPGSLEQLKKLSGTRQGYGRHGLQPDPEYTALMESNPSPEQMISEAKKYPSETRRSIYMNAANKFSESGQFQSALSLLNEHFEGDALENAVNNVAWQQMQQLIQKQQFDAAEAAIMGLSDGNRNSALVSLAQTMFGVDREKNKARAATILSRARGLIPERPTNNSELGQLFTLINAFTVIDPSEAFREFEMLTDELNRVIEASAIVNAFQGGNLREGEYMLSGGFNFGVHLDPNVLRSLAQSDYERTEALIDMFTKPEVRIMLKLYVAEGGEM